MGQAPDCCNPSHRRQASNPGCSRCQAGELSPHAGALPDAETAALPLAGVVVVVWGVDHDPHNLIHSDQVNPATAAPDGGLPIPNPAALARSWREDGWAGSLADHGGMPQDSLSIQTRKGQPWLTDPDCCKA